MRFTTFIPRPSLSPAEEAAMWADIRHRRTALATAFWPFSRGEDQTIDGIPGRAAELRWPTVGRGEDAEWAVRCAISEPTAAETIWEQSEALDRGVALLLAALPVAEAEAFRVSLGSPLNDDEIQRVGQARRKTTDRAWPVLGNRAAARSRRVSVSGHLWRSSPPHNGIWYAGSPSDAGSAFVRDWAALETWASTARPGVYDVHPHAEAPADPELLALIRVGEQTAEGQTLYSPHMVHVWDDAPTAARRRLGPA